MANWSAPAPTAPERENWLHDQEQLPPAPTRSRGDYVRGYMPFILGLLFTAALVALAFEARASWGSHRDWVVPTTIPLIGLGGVAMGYLIHRRAWFELMPGVLLLLIVAGLTALNIWRGAVTDGSDGLRDALSISQGVGIGLTVLALWLGMAYVEATKPLRAPEPEV